MRWSSYLSTLLLPATLVAGQFIASPPTESKSQTGYSIEDHLSIPRRSEAVPNDHASHAVFTQSEYNVDDDVTTSGIWILDVKNGLEGQSDDQVAKLLVNDTNAASPNWLDSETIVFVSNGNTSLFKSIKLDGSNLNTIGEVSPPIIDYSLKKFDDGNFGIVIVASADEHGALVSKDNLTNPWGPTTEARIYDSIYIRHWNYYLTQARNSLFTSQLIKTSDGVWSLVDGEKHENLVNVMAKGPAGLESPIPPFGGLSDFDFTDSLVAFISKPVDLPRANHTASYVYISPFDASSPPKPINANGKGASGSPKFSPNKKLLAFTQMDEDGYESDKAKLYVYDIENKKIIPHIHDWPYAVGEIAWSDDSNTLYFTAEVEGYVSLFSLDLQDKKAKNASRVFQKLDGSISAFYKLKDKEQFFITSTLFTQNAIYSLLDIEDSSTKHVWESPELKNKFPPVEEFWYDCTKGDKCHGFLLKPIGFDNSKKYPLLFYIHGGPQVGMTSSWNTRVSLETMANAGTGFVVAMINFSGSTGYGQKFVDKITQNWGGDPYEDLILGFDYLGSKYKYIDTKNAVASGASYGGYMVNWISGNKFADKFKALITHDGVFNTLQNFYEADEIWFVNHDFGGAPWENLEVYEKWNPERHIKNWRTPHLIIHNTKDYRLGESNGISAFNVLQLRGIPSRFLSFPDEDHWVLKSKNLRVWYHEVLGWQVQWAGSGSKKDANANQDGDIRLNREDSLEDLSNPFKVQLTQY